MTTAITLAQADQANHLMKYGKAPDMCSTCLPYLGLNEDLYFMVRSQIHGRKQDTAAHFPR